MDKKLLILDIDETMVSSRYAGKGDFQVGPFVVTKRPFLDEFLAKVVEIYDLAIWTSSSSDYATGVIQEIIKHPLKFLWTESRCTSRVDMETGERFHVKNLKKVKEDGYDLSSVLIVDDSPEKLKLNYGNLVRVPEFTGDPSDTVLKALKCCSFVKVPSQNDKPP